MNNPALSSYSVILDNKYYLQDIVESIKLTESLEEISCRASVSLVVTPDLPALKPNLPLTIAGIPFAGGPMKTILDGVIWETHSSNRGLKYLDMTVYDKTIFLAKSEDEYLFPAGQTASQRLQKYAKDWDIDLSTVEDTGIALAKTAYRVRPIYSMIQADLEETVKKGGHMYRVHMTPQGLKLVKLGSNKPVWVLDTGENLEEVSQHRTLEGTVTQVKVLGQTPEEGRSPILAVEKGETETYGTLQKVYQMSKLTNTQEARDAARQLLSGLQETFSVTGLDINTLRAGDRVLLNGLDLLVVSASHDLGSPGRMTLELGWEDYVRRRFYHD